MVFSSHIFLFYFLPLLLLIYYNLPHRWRNLFLTISSYLFYGWWNPWFSLLMLFATAANYLAGRVISRPGASERQRFTALVLGVTASLGALAFFKYFMFLENNMNSLLWLFGADALPTLRVILPIGISFFTFQSLSYSVDVYRRQSPPVRSFSDFACFVALFPQLIAGPIVRYNTVAEQLVHRQHTASKFSSGVSMFILGFAQKILLANPMGEIANSAFAADTPLPMDAWMGAVAYAFQIYFDFNAYSSMAIGLGRMVGFEFPKNFNAPYLADSITDFWRRWHISLSTFLRDYLYIPLGGNRKGPRRTYINLALVMILGGAWHGAHWNFIAWGAWHGGLLALERWGGKKSIYGKLPHVLRIGITFVLVVFSWVLFRSPTLAEAMHYFGCMFGIPDPGNGAVLLAADIYTPRLMFMMALCAFLCFQRKQAFDLVTDRPCTWRHPAILIPLFVLCLMAMFAQSYNPFLYFQF